MGAWYGSVSDQANEREVTVAEKVSEKSEMVPESHPAKTKFFATGELFLLTGCPLMGAPTQDRRPTLRVIF
jgi:hypothetical protein